MPDEGPPADSIFAVMSPKESTTAAASPSIPRLGMLVDRTSFEEPDDFGVSQRAIQAERYAAAPPVVTKDGKVRRRMRWRPQAMVKRKRPQPKSSDCGSVGNNSYSSKHSKKSLHSFASTETAEVKNTTNAKRTMGRFPLPRPSPKPVTTAVATIGNEMDFVQARIDGSAVFEAADAAPSSRMESPRRAGLPPLFRPIKTKSNAEESHHPVPELSGDEIENEKRVDLRIPTPTVTTPGPSVEATMSMQELRVPDEDRQDKASPKRQTIKNAISEAFVAMKRRDGRPEPLEIRFSMSEPNSPATATTTTKSSLSESSSSDIDASSFFPSFETASRKATVPADVDDGAFFEAEKNLQAIHEMATEHLDQGEYNEALEVFEEILRGQLARYGENHHRVGTALHNLGIVHMRRGDFAKALEVYKEAVRVRKHSLESDHQDVAVSLAQLGVAYMESHKHRKAIGAFREALKIRRKCLGNEHPKVAKILNNIGCSLFELNELQVAQVAFEEALDIQRSLLRKPTLEGGPISQRLLLSIASTQSNIASIKLYCGAYQDACVDLEEALLIQQCVLGDDHPQARRTQESLAWMEQSWKNGNSLSVDILNRLAASMSLQSPDQRSRSDGMLHTLYSGIDAACRGWDKFDEPPAASPGVGEAKE